MIGELVGEVFEGFLIELEHFEEAVPLLPKSFSEYLASMS